MNKRKVALIVLCIAFVIVAGTVAAILIAGNGNAFSVRFTYADGKTIDTVKVGYGEDAVAPEVRTADGEVFFGWDSSIRNITENKTVKAVTYKVTPAEWYTYSTTYDKDATSAIGFSIRMKSFLGDAGDAETIVLPSEVDGEAVVSLKYTCLNANSVNTAVKTVVVPYGVSKIESNAFFGCRNLETVLLPETVKWIDSDAFEGCISLRSIVLPASLKYVYGNSFDGTYPMDISISEDSDNLRVLDGNIVSRDGGTLVAFTNYGKSGAMVSGVFHTVGEKAFYHSKVQRIVLPETVRTIAKSAFEGCEELESVDGLSALETIEDCAFKGCLKLSEFTLHDAVAKIGAEAFSRTGITRIVLPAGLTNVGRRAFGQSGVEIYTPREKEDFRLGEEEWADGNIVRYNYDGSPVR